MSPHDELHLLSAYVDGEASPEERARIDAHIPSCAECRATLEGLRLTIAELRGMPEPAPTAQDSWALRSAIRRERTPVRRWQRAAVAAASIAAVAVAVLAFALPGRNDDGPSIAALPESAGVDVQVLTVDGNLDSAAAHARLLQAAGLTMDQLFAKGPPPPTTRSSASGAGGSVVNPTAAPAEAYAVTDASSDTTLAAIDRCVQAVRASTQEFLQPLKYEIATYESTPAFLLFFRATERIEMWVTARDGCRILFFAQAQT